ncbi:VRR-NUC domain-containing protein [Nioella ostreopsis]|uniref:VRR-NUC domain-containing protein n=1 Tax=Nioella ostreopsis TaxID=2448479 RepID=UPI0013E04818|nr:VRR-NUC domain-containing protein [Nioella ostreopsis]
MSKDHTAAWCSGPTPNKGKYEVIEISQPLIIDSIQSHGKTQWVSPNTKELVTVEEAAAGWFRKNGYYASHDYRAILDSLLISTMYERPTTDDVGQILLEGLMTTDRAKIENEKAALFGRHAHGSGGALERAKNELAKKHEECLNAAPSRSREGIEKNLRSILPRIVENRESNLKKARVAPHKDYVSVIFGTSMNSEQRITCALALLSSLGIVKLIELQRFHAQRRSFNRIKGWPDLLIWNNQDCFFREVKSPGDKLSDDQESIIAQLKRMGIDADVLLVTDGRAIKSGRSSQEVGSLIPASNSTEGDSLNSGLRETVVALERMHSLRQRAFANEFIYGLETTYYFISEEYGLQFPYVDGSRIADFSNNFAETQNRILRATKEKLPKEFSEVKAELDSGRKKLARYLSEVDVFELEMKESYFELPFIWISTESGKPRFGISIDRESFIGGKSKPFFLRKVTATLELLHKELPATNAASRNEFHSWYCRFTEQSGGPVRARTLRAAVFKFFILRPWILMRSDQFGRPVGPIICEDGDGFPGIERLNDERIKVEPPKGYTEFVDEASNALQRLKANG